MKRYYKFPDGSIVELDDADIAGAVAAGAVEYTGGNQKQLYKFPDNSLVELDEADFDGARTAGAVQVSGAVKKKESGVSENGSLSLSTSQSPSKSTSTRTPVLTDEIRRGLRLNPQLSSPSLDRDDVAAVVKQQEMSGQLATLLERKTIKNFLDVPTLEGFDDDDKRDVLDQVFSGKETELNIQGKLDDKALRQLADERKSFSERFYAGQLTGEDIETIKQSNPIAYPEEYSAMSSNDVAAGINTKTNNLAMWSKGVVAAGASEYIITKNNIAEAKRKDEQALNDLLGTNYIYRDGDSFATNIPERQYMVDKAKQLQKQIREADTKLSFVNKTYNDYVYKPEEERYFNDIVGEISSMYSGMKPEDIYKWEGGLQKVGGESMEASELLKKLHNDPSFKMGDIIKYDETNQLTPASVERIRKLITDHVNTKRSPIIEAHEHGEVNRQQATGDSSPGVLEIDVTTGGKELKPIDPQDLITRTINYFNYQVPAKVLAEAYTAKFKNTETGKKIAPLIEANKKLERMGTSFAEFESGLRATMDAGYITLNDKYNKLLTANPDFINISRQWQERVDNKLITPQQAYTEIIKEASNNPALKSIFDSKGKEVNALRNNANKLREKYIINGVSAIDSNVVLDDSGRLTIKGMTREEVDAAIEEYNKGYGEDIEKSFAGQEQLLANKADFINQGMRETFGSFGGSLAVGMKSSIDDLGASVARWLYHKTGDAGDALNYFEAERARPLNIGEYAENHYRYKGLGSLLDPAYYGFATGQSFPYAAPALVAGVASGGSVPGIIAASGFGATLETAENALITRNELFTNGRDKDGLKINSKEADRIAAEQFRKELLPNIAFQAIELGSLLRATKYASPAFGLKTAAKGIADVAVAGGAEAVQEGVQGFVQYNVNQEATGKPEVDIFDYMQTDDFTQNFFGGFAGGLVMGGGVKPMQYAKSLANWKEMVKDSKDAFRTSAKNDFADSAPFANALHAQINGTSGEYRDGIRLRLENEQYENFRERENLQRVLHYSESLDKVVKNEGIVPSDINTLYAAHNAALADVYEGIADRDKGLSNQSKVYQQQANKYRSEATAAFDGSAKVYYATDALGRPIFMTEKTAKVLAESGTLAKWKGAGLIQSVNSFNDNAYNSDVVEKINTIPVAPVREAAQAEPVKQTTTDDLYNRSYASMKDGALKNMLQGADVVGDRQGGVKMLTDQALQSSGGLLSALNNNTDLVTDLIAANTEEAINGALDDLYNRLQGDLREDDGGKNELDEINAHINLLEQGLEKRKTYDSQNEQRVAGQVGEREEPVEGQPQQVGSTPEAGSGGVVQSPSKTEEEIRGAAGAIGATVTDEDIDDITSIYEASQETDTPLTPKEAFDFYNAERATRPATASEKLDAAKERLKNAWNNFKNVGVISDPKENAKKDLELYAALFDLAGSYISKKIEDFVAAVKDLLGVTELPVEVQPLVQKAWNDLTLKPTREPNESMGQYAVRVMEWRKRMMESDSGENQARALSQSQEELDFVKGVNAGIELLLEKDADGNMSNMKMPVDEFNRRLGLPAGSTETYVAALKSLRGRTTEATDRLNELRKESPKVIAMTEIKLLRKQFYAYDKGIKEGINQVAAIRDEIDAMLKEYNELKLFSGVTYSPKELLRMASYVNNAISPKTLDTFKQMVTRLLEKADYGRKINEARAAAKEIRKMLRNKDVLTASEITLLRELASTNPLRVSDIDKHIDILKDVADSRMAKETPVRKYGNDTIAEHVANEHVYDIQQTAKEVMDRFYEILTDEDFILLAANGKIANFLSEDNLQNVVNGIISDTTQTYKESLSSLGRIQENLDVFFKDVKSTAKLIYEGQGSVTLDDVAPIDYLKTRDRDMKSREDRRLTLENQAKAQQQSIDLDDPSLSEEQKEILGILKELDVTGMDSSTLRLFMNVLNNIVMNDDMAGSGIFRVKAEARNNVVKKFTDWLTGGGYKVRQKKEAKQGTLKSKVSDIKRAFTSTEQVIWNIANNSASLAAKIFESIQMDKIKRGYVKTVTDLKEKVVDPLNKLFEAGLRQDTKSNIRLTIYSWLNQDMNGSPQENQQEFIKRIGEIKRDIAIKEQFGKEADKKEAALIKEEYADLRKQILDKTGIDIDAEEIVGLSPEVINEIDWLSESQKDAYNHFRSIYDETRPQFEEIMQTYLNKEFNGWNNYMPDTFRKLNGGIISVDISAENFGKSIFAEAETGLDDASGAFNERTKGNRLIEPKPGEDTRVINYNWFDNNVNNAKSMMFDINTLPARQVASEVFKSKDMQDNVGLDNMTALKETLIKELRGMTEYKGKPSGRYFQAFKEATNILGGLAAKVQLASVFAYIKQAWSAYMNTAAYLGKDAPYLFKAYRMVDKNEDMQRLIASEEIGLRGTTKAGTNIFSDKNISENDARLDNKDVSSTFRKVSDFVNSKNNLTGDEKSLMLWFLHRGDVISAQTSWIALYGQWLINNGVYSSWKDIDWKAEADNVNRDAASYAQLVTAKQLNVNSRNAFGEVYTEPSAANSILKGLFGLFGNFGFNKTVSLINNAQTLASKSGDIGSEQRGEEKEFAIRSLAAGIAEEITYQTVKGVLVKLTLSPLFWGLMRALTDDPDEDALLQQASERDRANLLEKTAANVISNYFFSFAGSEGQTYIQSGLNNVLNYFGKENFFFEPSDNPNKKGKSGLFYAATGGIDDDMYRMWRLMTEREDRFGAEVQSPTRNEYILASLAIISNLAQMAKVNDADLNRLIHKRLNMMDVEIAKRYADPYWRDVAKDNALTDELQIGGRRVKLNKKQQEYYYQQKKKRLDELDKAPLTKERKAQMAAEFGKSMLMQEYRVGDFEAAPPEK